MEISPEWQRKEGTNVSDGWHVGVSMGCVRTGIRRCKLKSHRHSCLVSARLRGSLDRCLVFRVSAAGATIWRGQGGMRWGTRRRMIFARNITSSLYADIIVYLDNLIFRNFQDEELPPAVLRAIGWTRTPHDVEHAAVPDLTVHLLLDPREGHLRLESKEGAVLVSAFPRRDFEDRLPVFRNLAKHPDRRCLQLILLELVLERRGARHLGVELFRSSLITLGPHLHLLLPLVCHRRRLAALIVEVSPLTLDGASGTTWSSWSFRVVGRTSRSRTRDAADGHR